jgi:hypothetical protein
VATFFTVPALTYLTQTWYALADLAPGTIRDVSLGGPPFGPEVFTHSLHFVPFAVTHSMAVEWPESSR